MRVNLNSKHLKQRLNQRSALPVGFEAQQFLDTCKRTIESKAPEDWRFTRHPAARFFISYIDETTNIKFHGSSYRKTPESENIWKRLYALAQNRHGFTDLREMLRDLASLADAYKAEVASPDGTIVHELETIYDPAWGLLEKRRGYEALLKDIPHAGHLQLANGHLATRPNALFLPAQEGDGRLFELWVRQSDPYVKPDPETGHLHESYCVFCPLTPEGIRVEEGALWRFHGDGEATRAGGARCRPPLAPVVAPGLPDGFRSGNYWSLPTLIDDKYLSLRFRQRHALLTMRNQEIMLIHLIEGLYQISYGKRKPRWFP